MRQVILFFILSSYSTQAQNFFEQYNHIPVSKNGTALNLAWTGGVNTPQFSDIDFNDDGYMDMVIFDRDDENYIPIYHYPYTGPGQYGYEYDPSYIKNFPKTPYWALLKDINLDGKPDLLTSSIGNIRYYKNTSVGSELSFEFIEILKSQRNGGPYIKIFVNNVDIPVFEDVDYDGDIDILTFSSTGTYIELNENISETLGEYDFRVTDKCWGDFSENFSTNDVTLDDPSCMVLQPPMKMQEPLHSGSTVALYDLDNDSDMDIMLGDVSFNNIVQLTNQPVAGKDFMVSKVNNFPISTPIDLTVFPAIYFTDFDNDGAKDMLVSPSSGNDSDSKNSVWFYKNNGTTELPNFVFNKKNALQDQMIDVGRYSKVRLFDYNTDGKMDIIVSAGQIYKPDGLYSSLTLLKNTGTTTNPQFAVETEDFANLESLNLGTQVVPSFGDLDNDGKEDMILGNQDGTLLFFKNNSTTSNPWNFNINSSILSGLDVGNNSTPQIYDLDGDGKKDLIVGNRKGEFSYFRNTGSLTNPSFTLITDFLGELKVGEGSTFGFADFFIHKEGTEDIIYTGSYRDNIHRISNITGNLNGTFTVTDSNVHELGYLRNSSPALYDFNNNGYLDLIVGHIRGGVEYYKGIDELYISLTEISKSQFSISPNPAKETLLIKTNVEWETVVIRDIRGRVILNQPYTESLTISNFNQGLYLITVQKGKQTETLKFNKM